MQDYVCSNQSSAPSLETVQYAISRSYPSSHLLYHSRSFAANIFAITEPQTY